MSWRFYLKKIDCIYFYQEEALDKLDEKISKIRGVATAPGSLIDDTKDEVSPELSHDHSASSSTTTLHEARDIINMGASSLLTTTSCDLTDDGGDIGSKASVFPSLHCSDSDKTVSFAPSPTAIQLEDDLIPVSQTLSRESSLGNDLLVGFVFIFSNIIGNITME